VPLPADIGSDAFNSAYLAALAGQSEAKGRARSVHARGSIAALIASYLCSAGYRSLRQTTKSGYASRIEVLRTQHGHRTIQGLTRERIVAVLQPYAARPGAALSILKMLRVLIRHAIDIGWLKYDPSSGIRRPKTQEIRSWSDTEIEAFEHRWPVGAKQRLAFALLLYTGQRRSDVHRMTWADVSGRTIRVVQQKTGRKLAIPLHSELLAALLAADRDHVTIINTEYGKPFTVDGFSQWMRAAITAAGRRLAEAGCTANEIMSVLGHRTLAEAERYTRDADQARLATDAVTKLEGHKANKPAQTDARSLGRKTKTEENSK